MERSQQELKFIDQYTRKLMVKWADVCVQAGELPPDQFKRDSTNPYVQHAFNKGWITKSSKQPRRLTASGWGVAASFLKR